MSPDAVLGAILGPVVVIVVFLAAVSIAPPPEEPWTPECPLARAELARARSISWDYDKFRYHLSRAVELERQFQARKPR